MRVLQINKFFHPSAGAETAFLQTRELLQANGDDVIDFAMRHPDNIESPYARFFAPTRGYGPEVGTIRRARDGFWSVYSVPARRALGRLLRAHRPDVAHLHTIYHQLTLSLVDELVAHRIPIVLTLHDWKVACPAYTLFTEGAPCRRCPRSGVLEAVRHRCIKHSAAGSTLAAGEALLAKRRGTYLKIQRFIAPSRFAVTVAGLAGIDPDRVEHIPNFLPDVELAGEVSHRDFGPRLVYAGRLEEIKGIRPLLAAFAMVKAPASLRIAGTGALEQEVRSAAASDPRITYLGGLPRSDVYRELERARAVVLPSLVEDNCPLILLEAQARARPMIVTDRGGPPEFVRTDETGLVVDPEDLAGLAAAMERLASDPCAARIWGNRARQQVCEEHAASTHYRRLSGVYAASVAALANDAPPRGRWGRVILT